MMIEEERELLCLAALFNATKLFKKDLKKIKICLFGAGAAGFGVFEMLKEIGVKNLICVDKKGIIFRKRKGDNKYQKEIAKFFNPQNLKRPKELAIKDADVFIGLSGKGNLISAKEISLMKKPPIIFALSNPDPEILPNEIEKVTKNYLYATGKSDFENQINNALAFPGVFRGILKKRKNPSLKLKVKIAKEIAKLVKKPREDKILPSLFDERLPKAIEKCF